MRNTAAFLAFIMLSPLLGAQSAAPASAPVTPAAEAAAREAQLRAFWSRNNTAATVANVNGDIVTAEDIRNELRPLTPHLRQESRDEEDYNRRINEMASKALDQLVERELVLSEAKEKGIQMPASYVNEMVEEKIIREYNGDRTEYINALRRMGRTPIEDRRDMQDRTLVDYLGGQMRKSVSELSPEKIQRYYDTHKEAFNQSASVKISQIALWAGAADTDDEVRRQAKEIIAAIEKGEPFDELARKYSKDASRDNGGDTGWREVDSLNEDLSKSILALPDGGCTPPIEFRNGDRLSVYIIKRDAFRPAGPRPIGEVSGQIEEKLITEAMRIAREEWFTRLRERFYVRYFD